MKAAFYTLGCKVNQYETQAMSEKLRIYGFDIVSEKDVADIYIVNSCTVTATADKKTRQTVRHLKRANPNAVVVLTGCMPQAYPDSSHELLEADIVLGNKDKPLLAEKIKEYFDAQSPVFCVSQYENNDTFSNLSVTGFGEHTRAFIKIQDGCNRFCSYCVIPYARGRSRSKPLDELKKELLSVADTGYSEVVLVGINLSSYGKDIGADFCDAVELACSIDKIKRVRLGSLEPDHITDEVIKRLAKLPKLCPQFHISLQSGCNNTLKNMNRHYTAEEYKALCNSLRLHFKNATLTTDVMVGFQGESDEDFAESLQFVKDIAFEKVHVFPYSPRPGTKASAIKPQILNSVKEERSKIMIDETNVIRKNFLNSQIGKTVNVLFETAFCENERRCIDGYTENYTPVRTYTDEDFKGQIKKVLITDKTDEYCIGKIL